MRKEKIIYKLIIIIRVITMRIRRKIEKPKEIMNSKLKKTSAVTMKFSEYIQKKRTKENH